MHTVIAYAAAVMTAAVVLLQILALFKNRPLFYRIAVLSHFTTAFVIIAAWYTGTSAGRQLFGLLGDADKQILFAHGKLGTYLAILLAVLAIINFMGCRLKRRLLSIVVVIGLLAGIVKLVNQFDLGRHLTQVTVQAKMQ